MDPLKEVRDEVSSFFRSLGFTVSWDFNKQSGLHWYEVYDGDNLLCQVDFGVPLMVLRTDLVDLAHERACSSGYEKDWQVRGSLSDLLRIAKAIQNKETP